MTAKWIDEMAGKKKRFISPDFRGLGSSPSKREKGDKSKERIAALLTPVRISVLSHTVAP